MEEPDDTTLSLLCALFRNIKIHPVSQLRISATLRAILAACLKFRFIKIYYDISLACHDSIIGFSYICAGTTEILIDV